MLLCSPSPNPGEIEPHCEQDRKYVFVCGMPRSGTTILAKEIGRLRNCTGFEKTGVIMDEGQYLQDVYPTEWECGGAGRFGFDPRSHLTEASPLLTQDKIHRLCQSWKAYWDETKMICVEKTPGNLLKTRFLQSAFPNAYFIVIKRHPVAVSLATQKWSLTSLHELFEHWLLCHKILNDDKKRLEHLYELSYERYIEDPKKHLEEIARFIGTELPSHFKEQAADGYNNKYFSRWTRMLQTSPFRTYYRRVAGDFEPRFREHEYSIAPATSVKRPSIQEGAAVRRVLTQLLYVGSDIFFAIWRAGRSLRIRIENATGIKHLYSVPEDSGSQRR